MRILHLIDSGGLYGAEQMLLALAAEQVEQGLEPAILSAGSPGEPEKPLEAEARRRNLRLIPWRMRPGLNLKEGRRILAWAKREGYQLLHSHGYKFNILSTLCRRRRDRLPTLTTLHGYVNARFPSKMWLYERADHFALRFMDAVVLVSPTMETLPAVRRLPPARRTIIPNGLPETTDPLPALPEPIASFRARFRHCWVSVGRLSREKGHDVMLEAFATLARERIDCGLVIIGDGPLAEPLLERIATLGLTGRVLLAGYHANAASMLAHFDGLVMASYTEGLPITLLEAMRDGVPIIATRVGGVPTLLTADSGDECGRLIEPGNPDQLADALRQTLAYPNTTRTLALAALDCFKLYYGATAMAEHYVPCYQTICKHISAAPWAA